MKMYLTMTKITGVFVGLVVLLAAPQLMAQERFLVPQIGEPHMAPPAGTGSVITPYRYNPAPQNLSPAEQQQALEYQSQLQSQQREIEQQQAEHPSNPQDRQEYMDNQTELNRMYNVLHP